MINVKSFFVLLICVLLFYTTHSQSKYGNDSLACMESYGLFIICIINKKIMILHYLHGERLFNICPASSENIFKHGPIIMKHKMKSDPENKLLYLDTLYVDF